MNIAGIPRGLTDAEIFGLEASVKEYLQTNQRSSEVVRITSAIMLQVNLAVIAAGANANYPLLISQAIENRFPSAPA